ncbi:MAG: hypothetical protein ACRDK1_04670 [Solirubrobacterales bacterium]
MSELDEIRPGLWHWTAAHPEWRRDARPGSEGDWPRLVGSVLIEASDATVLIDPLIPADGGDELLRELDLRIRGRGLPVTILTTIKFHRRSRDLLAERYAASISRARSTLPAGIEPHPIKGAGETMFWLAEHRTLVPGDRILGAPGGGLRICPESWISYLPSGISTSDLRDRLRLLLELPIERVLVSHGDPVLSDGRAALALALDA